MPSKLNIPELFSELLKGSEFAGPVYDYIQKVSIILADNKLPFFPHYTEHGLDHVATM